MGYFLHHLDPDRRKITRRLERLYLRIFFKGKTPYSFTEQVYICLQTIKCKSSLFQMIQGKRKNSLVLFNSLIVCYQLVPLWNRVGLGAMAITRYSSFPKAQQEFEYTLLKPDCHSWWISKMPSGREDTLEERYAIKLCFKLGNVIPQKRMKFFRLLLDHLAWMVHQFLRGIRDSSTGWEVWEE